jgi:hypothetical protein
MVKKIIKAFWSVLMISLGMLSNKIVEAFNYGYMPVNSVMTKAHNLNNLALQGTRVRSNENTRLLFLGDTIYIPDTFIKYRLVSIGDLLMWIGFIILLIQCSIFLFRMFKNKRIIL